MKARLRSEGRHSQSRECANGATRVHVHAPVRDGSIELQVMLNIFPSDTQRVEYQGIMMRQAIGIRNHLKGITNIQVLCAAPAFMAAHATAGQPKSAV